MRLAVIGDVGGQFDSLSLELERIGVDVGSGVVPHDLVVVQVGDLVHRGPASEQVVALVDRLVTRSPGRWVQLVGNHEAQYLRHPAFQWRSWVDAQAQKTLVGWWEDHRLVAAHAAHTEAGDVLVTHAGITHEFWRRDLGSPRTAHEAAARLNDLAERGSNALFRDGVMLTGRTTRRAGPLWAEAGREVIPGWQVGHLPFHQVHGHSSLYDWQRRAWRPSVPEQVRRASVLDLWNSHETTWLGQHAIVGVDPGHMEQATADWHAWTPSLLTASVPA